MLNVLQCIHFRFVVPLREAVGRPSLDFTCDSPPNIKMAGM
jgi:hypothetical protein